MAIRVTTSPAKSEIAHIHQSLINYNLQFFSEDIHSPLAVFYEQEEAILGGITGSILGNWLRIDYFWLEESLRKQGIGSQLLQAMENKARELGAKYAQVDTFSFQAKPFYEKQGYQVISTLIDYPIKHKRYYFMKSL
ncbi:GNAT family N-acetyltransferase [Providencia stuartii]|uniref:GNAT family N-acetyltransferase n=1 Tax=Providencia stuartii TaxID=588 RepID=UPI001FF1A990|nr:GNAT family N-acetyltransferase [Providencia stuartii]ELZ5940672.1 GNAT family N-acetyltransferase [Providencia stuartii]MCK1144464.1 GNAT family N-acetyltransferase [Providencia stuartii]